MKELELVRELTKLEEISKEIKKYGIRNNTIISTLPIGIIRPIKNETPSAELFSDPFICNLFKERVKRG